MLTTRTKLRFWLGPAILRRQPRRPGVALHRDLALSMGHRHFCAHRPGDRTPHNS